MNCIDYIYISILYPGNADVDFTGAVIESDKPLSVTVGNRCYQRDSNDAQHSVWASMPPSSALGTTYMAANVGLDTLNAFGVKVRAPCFHFW